jgi:hypothetical protein
LAALVSALLRSVAITQSFSIMPVPLSCLTRSLNLDG